MKTGLFYCFACKTKSNVKALAQILGGAIIIHEVKAVNLNRVINFEWALSCPNAYNNEYLQKRGVTNEQVEQFDIRAFDGGIVFPLIGFNEATPQGALIRLINSNIRYIILGQRTPGWPLFNGVSFDDINNIIIVEGVFSVLRAHQRGVSAFATLSSSFSDITISYIKAIFGPKAISLFDNDYAGYTGAIRLLKAGIYAYQPGCIGEPDETGEWGDLKDKRVFKFVDDLRAAAPLEIRERL